MEIIRNRKHVTSVSHTLAYRYNDASGAISSAGFSFNCDEHGNVDESRMAAAGLDNLRKCQDGTHDVTLVGVERYENSYVEAAVGRCSCGSEVSLDAFTNTCHDCGADYNMSGQRLAPRSQWGYETGEHWTECY